MTEYFDSKFVPDGGDDSGNDGGDDSGNDVGAWERVLHALLFAYITVIPFHDSSVWLFRLGPLTLADVAFLPLAAVVGLALVTRKRQFWWSPLDLVVVAWVGVHFFSFGWTEVDGALIKELVRAIYLAGLYFVVRLLATHTTLRRFPGWFTVSACVACALGIGGWAWNFLGHPNILSWQMEAYPYFGPVGRAKGFCQTPNMLGSILMVAICLKFAECREKLQIRKLDWAILAFMVSGMFFAISKTAICMGTGCVLIWYLTSCKKTRERTWLVASFVAAIFIAFNLISHVVVMKRGAIDIPANREVGYLDQQQLGSAGNYVFIATSYTLIRRAGFEAIRRHFPAGVGIGRFNKFIDKLKAEGTFPNETASYDPHCTALGALVELGLPGLLALLVLFSMTAYCCWESVRAASAYHGLAVGLCGCLAGITIESSVVDVMNFRHYWILLALLAVVHQRRRWKKMGVSGV